MLTIGLFRSLLSFLFLFFFLLLIFAVLACRDPAISVVLAGLVLAGEINSFAFGGVGLSPLAQIAGASGQLRSDLRGSRHPVCQCVFAILDDGLGSLIAIVGIACLAWGDRVVVDEFEKVLSVASNDRRFFTMLAERIKLVVECGLQLLTSNIGQLGFSNKRFCLGTDEFLFEDDDARTVWFLVLELGNLVGDLLLAVAGWLD